VNLKERALGLLARREHSRAELARKLAAHGEPEEIATLLDELEARKYLSDERYAEALRHVRSGRHGSLRLRQELRQKGVSEVIVETEIAQARDGDFAAAQAVWQKKFGAPPADLKEKAKQMRFLLSRGFPSGIAARVVGGGFEGEADY
jgi:regulatory protein